MASSSHQVLEVTQMSATDLKRVTLLSKMHVYAAAYISGDEPRLPMHRTDADLKGGCNPTRHTRLRFTVPHADDAGDPARHVLRRAEYGAFGEVVVPVRELTAAEVIDDEQQRHLSYPVRRPVSRRHRGMLCISYRLTDVPAVDSAAQPCYGHHHQCVHEVSKWQQQHKSGSAAVTTYPMPAYLVVLNHK